MTAKDKKSILIRLAVVIGTASILSFFWHIPYIFTLIGFSAWVFFGHLITIDDDLPGGWSNPDGKEPFPWIELLVKAAVFLGLCALAGLFPITRSFGA